MKANDSLVMSSIDRRESSGDQRDSMDEVYDAYSF